MMCVVSIKSTLNWATWQPNIVEKELPFDVQLDYCKSLDGRFIIGLILDWWLNPIRARSDDCNHMIEGPNF